MAVITLPSALAIASRSGNTFGQRRFDLVGAGDAAGTSQVRLFGPPKWAMSLRCPEGVTINEGVEWETLLLQLRGAINHLQAWDVNRPAPRGTMRGTLTLSGAVAAGATTASITGGAGQAGTTLRKGDPLQFGTGVGTSQLVRVTADATANGSGVISVTFEPPARIAFSGGASVTWDKASAYFKSTNDGSDWNYHGTQAMQGFALDLIENWTP